MSSIKIWNNWLYDRHTQCSRSKLIFPKEGLFRINPYTRNVLLIKAHIVSKHTVEQPHVQVVTVKETYPVRRWVAA